ncbi:MAG: hypothetical protein HN474_08100 [Nitrospina sp.]|jgi:hypothetical protein|nr:hypothetical protein [Nitrospina sp.]
MFYDVKVFDSRGELKKVVSSKKLSNRFWKTNDNLPSFYQDSFSKSEDLNSKEQIQAGKIRVEEGS